MRPSQPARAMPADNKPANVLIVLPERTYANDCIVVELKKADQIGISL